MNTPTLTQYYQAGGKGMHKQKSIFGTSSNDSNDNNIVDNKEYQDLVCDILEELIGVLCDHCGPYSGTAILVNPSNVLAEPVFTKDGINIINSIRYTDPRKDFVRQQLSYMGSRVDRGAGDGTTSTMIVMANAILSMLKSEEYKKNKFTSYQLSEAWNELVSTIENLYNTVYYIEPKTPEEIRYIVGSQAYTSSHGDLELTKCIEELFVNTPSAVWDTLVAKKAAYESEEKYKVTINKSQYTLEPAVSFPRAGNSDYGTVLRHENVPCLITEFVAIGDDTQTNMIAMIDEKIAGTDPFIIICCNDMDMETQRHFGELFAQNPKSQTTFIMIPFDDPKLNDIFALKMLIDADKTIVGDYIVNLSLEYSNGICRITSGLFEDNGTGINPYFDNPKYPVYNENIQKIRTIIQREKTDITSKNAKQIERFTKLLNKLIATKDVVFTIGGAAYDNAAGRDIALDALMAAKCSLTKGFVGGRFVTLKHVLTSIKDTKISYKHDKLVRMFVNALLNSFNVIDACTIKNETLVSKYPYSPMDIMKLDDPSYEIPTDLSMAVETKKDYCIIQPMMTDLTFLKRFGELGLKFLTANSVIAAGQQWINRGAL